MSNFKALHTKGKKQAVKMCKLFALFGFSMDILRQGSPKLVKNAFFNDKKYKKPIDELGIL